MKVWFACIFVLFALAELFEWVQEFTLPLPIYILGGAFLAVASNYDQIVGSYFSNSEVDTISSPVFNSATQPELNLAATQTQPVALTGECEEGDYAKIPPT
jgi:ABC-type spermidine/putrescine transport system permease subunit II